jgi:hypothetical protein
MKHFMAAKPDHDGHIFLPLANLPVFPVALHNNNAMVISEWRPLLAFRLKTQCTLQSIYLACFCKTECVVIHVQSKTNKSL